MALVGVNGQQLQSEAIDIINKLMVCKYKKIKKFLIVGGSAALINIGLIYTLIDISGLDTYLLRNIANIIAMVISTLYAFILNRKWTWNVIPPKNGRQLLKQYFLYNLISLGGIFIRVVLFAFLDLLGLYYLLNVVIGIGTAAVFNFIMYDKHIFRKESSCEFK